MASRRVRQLRLTSPSDALVRKGALLVEDALRTASLPDADGGRVYVVKRLSLGAIDPRGASATVALAIEHRFAALRTQAVHASAAAAAASGCVWFADESEPWLLLVRRVAAGRSAHEWYWPLVTAGVDLRLPASLVLRAAVRAMARSALGTAVLVYLVTALDEGPLDALCASLQRDDGDVLLASSGWTAPPRELSRVDRQVSSVAAAVPSWVRRWVARWGPRDSRSVWLVTLAACRGSAAQAANPRLALRGAELAEAIAHARLEEVGALADRSAGLSGRVPEGEGGAPPGVDTPVRGPVAAPSLRDDRRERPLHSSATALKNALLAPVASASASAPTSFSKPDAEALAADPGALESASVAAASVYAALDCMEQEPSERSDRTERNTYLDGIPTMAAGLLFLIRPLIRLGFGQWLQEHPETVELGLPARIFLHVAHWTQVDANDPMLALFELPSAHEGGSIVPLPKHLARALGERTAQALCMRHATGQRAELEVPRALNIWRLGLALWIRRHARLSLRSVVHRRALLSATPTHVDLSFRLREADVRLRAVGLDLDPGWVPWLGRVVQFHYRDEE